MCSEKSTKTGRFDKIRLKCDFEIESIVYARKQSDLCSFALAKLPAYKITKKCGPNNVKSRNSDSNIFTVSVEDDDGTNLI